MDGYVLKREEYKKEIITALTELVLKIQNLNVAHFYDANTVAEDFFCGLLNRLYSWSLQNMNYLKSNYPGIDLGSVKDGLAVQVTSDGNRAKIQRTIRTFVENDYYKNYSRLIVLIIGTKPRYTKPFETEGLFTFDYSKDVIDLKDLIREIQSVDNINLIADIYNYVTSETGKIHRIEDFCIYIDKTKATVEALCRAKLKSIGVSDEIITNIIEKDINSDKYNYIVESNKTYLIGEYGVGKSHALFILFLKKYREYIDNKTKTIPCFSTARELGQLGGIQKWLSETIISNVDLLIFIDALDEVEYSVAIKIIEEIEFINERFKNVRIIVASREFATIRDSYRVQMKTLNDHEIDELYSIVTGTESRVSFYRRYSVKHLDYWKMLDRPFFLLVYALYITNQDFAIKNDIDAVAVFIDKILRKYNLTKTDSYDKLMHLAVASVNKNLGSIHRSEIDFDLDDIVTTGLVITEANSYYTFPFPIVVQWLASDALKRGIVNINNITSNKRNLLKWRYPLSIYFSRASFDGSKELFADIASKYPGIAGIIVCDGIKSEKQIKLDDSLTCGEKLQYCMNAWIKGLGKTAELLLLSNDGNTPNTLYANSNGNWLSVSWSAHRLDDLIITNEPRLGTKGFFQIIGMNPAAQATWPWIVTFETIRDRLKQCLNKRRIPVHGQIEKELIWRLALKSKHFGSLYNDKIIIADLLKFNPPQEIIESFVYEQKIFYKGLNKLRDSGETVIDPPYPTADLDYSKGGCVWSDFSRSQMKKRIMFEFEEGLKEYSYIVETFLHTIKNEMSLYATLPAKIIGQLEFDNPSEDTTWSSHPVLSWYILPLPEGAPNCVQLSYDQKVDLDDPAIWNEISNSRNKLRSENSEFVWCSMQSGMCFESTCTPVTDWVYDKLKKDLKKICWLK